MFKRRKVEEIHILWDTLYCDVPKVYLANSGLQLLKLQNHGTNSKSDWQISFNFKDTQKPYISDTHDLFK